MAHLSPPTVKPRSDSPPWALLFYVSLKPEVLERATPLLRQMLGYENYLSLGMIDGMPRNGMRY